VVPVTPPPAAPRVRHEATFAAPGERRTRYSLPASIESASPVGYRTRVSLTRPYRTPFTMLLTFIGHEQLTSPFTVAKRAWDKRFHRRDDIPTIGYLQHLHLGILAESMERAAVLASHGTRRAQVSLAPMPTAAAHAATVRAIEDLADLTAAERRQGWRVGLVAQVGKALRDERVDLAPALCRKLGANLLAFRSERIQPGVNAEESAPAQYQARQDTDVPAAFTEMAGRAAFNAFAHWTGCDREQAKRLMLIERVDVLTPDGKRRLREVRDELGETTDATARDIPRWADLPTGRALSRNILRGREAFALAGQRIYIGGLSRPEVEAAGCAFDHAVRAFGAAAARSVLSVELMGCVDLPDNGDLLAGACLMAGPVNLNDVGKQFYGKRDLHAGAHPGRDPTSLLVWTVKAKTVADPIGNEEQLMYTRAEGRPRRPAPGAARGGRARCGRRPRPDARARAERAGRRLPCVAARATTGPRMPHPVHFRQIKKHRPPRNVGPNLHEVFDVVHPRVQAAMLQAAAALGRVGVRHALVGGLAVGAYGYPRATKDVDFLVGNETFHDSEARVVIPRVELPYQIDGVAVDYIPVPIGAEFLDAALDAPQMCDGIPVAPIEVLVFMKLSSPRAKDAADIIELLKAGVLAAPVRAWLATRATGAVCARFESLVQQAEGEGED